MGIRKICKSVSLEGHPLSDSAQTLHTGRTRPEGVKTHENEAVDDLKNFGQKSQTTQESSETPKKQSKKSALARCMHVRQASGLEIVHFVDLF